MIGSWHAGRVAQSAERPPEKRKVTGSTPVSTTTRRSRVRPWPRAVLGPGPSARPPHSGVGETRAGRAGAARPGRVRPPDPLIHLVTACRGLLAAAGVLATLPVVASLVLRQVDVVDRRASSPTSPATPIVVFAGLGAVVLGLARLARTPARRRRPCSRDARADPGAAVPRHRVRARRAATPVTVMTLNMHYGGGDPTADRGGASATHDVDVLATEEMTTRAVEALRGAGIDDVLPLRRPPAPGARRATGCGAACR